MQFFIVIHGAPQSSEAAISALKFAAAAIDAGHGIYRVFFYHDAVTAANRLCVPPQDETSVAERWATFAQEHQLDLVVCVSAALRRGIIDANEAERHDVPADNLQPGFVISGLGQYADGVLSSDRVITFGRQA